MSPQHRIRPATQADTAAVHAISRETGLDDSDDNPSALAPMDDHHTWIVLEDETATIIGAAYFGPEGHSDRVWNLYFLAVSEQHQGGGTGSSLVAYVEADLRRRGSDVAKLLLIETSGTDGFAATRNFYAKLGYTEEARIREYYGPGDDKIVYWKMLKA